MRRWYLGRRLKRLGPGASIDVGMQIVGPENISLGSKFSCARYCTLIADKGSTLEIGDRASLNNNVHVNAGAEGRIVLGNDLLISPNVVLRASNHVTTALDRPMVQQGHTGGEIIIEDDVWLGSNVTVLAGAHIARGVVVAAGAVVNGPVEPYTIVGGVPARLIKKRGVDA